MSFSDPATPDAPPAARATGAAAVAAWVPDRGDGTYQNPVLFADYSDPDAIRVGDDFWLTASSFNHVPGLPILHSRDLVNWTLVNHALPALRYVDRDPGHFDVPRHGEGVWAPAIRHHAGKFWIYFPDPDFGLFVVTADDPRGRWSAPKLVRAGKGLIDPCPFWDDDGRGYLIHGWAKSRAGINNVLTLCELSGDGKRTLDEGRVVIDGGQLPGWHTIEGPKLYKRAGCYYIFAPAGGVTNGYQGVFRSRSIHGPYEDRIVLEQGGTPINGPHQGAWVSTSAGEDWFLHFQERGPFGRVVHLQPMVWGADGWPAIGRITPGTTKGEPVLVHRKPAPAERFIAVPATSDEFDGETLGRQWQWQANPQPGWALLVQKPRALRLTAVASPASNTLWPTPSLLLQKFSAPAFVATTQMRFSPAGEGEAAGLVVFGCDYAWLGLRHKAGGARIVYAVCHGANQGKTETEQTIATVAASTGAVQFRVVVNEAAACTFSYNLDAGPFVAVAGAFQAVVSRWVGAKVGLFAIAPADAPRTGHADFDWFRVAPLPAPCSSPAADPPV